MASEAVQCARAAVQDAKDQRRGNAESDPELLRIIAPLEDAIGELCAALEHLEPRVETLERTVRNIGNHPALV